MAPKVYLRLPEEVEPCDSILMDVGVSGAGAWDFSYQWSAEGFGSNNDAVAEILEKASNGKRKAVIKFNQDPVRVCMDLSLLTTGRLGDYHLFILLDRAITITLVSFTAHSYLTI